LESIPHSKQDWRQWARERLKAVPPEERARVGTATAKAAAPLLPREGKYVLIYASLKRELDSEPLWRMAQARGCFLALPRVAPSTPDNPLMETYRVKGGPTMTPLALGGVGVLEPEPDPALLVPPEKLVLAFVPGLAFDRSGTRLGRGGGYFDAYLARTAPHCLKVGVGYGWQWVDADLPRLPHDVPMDACIIDGQLIDLRPPGSEPPIR